MLVEPMAEALWALLIAVEVKDTLETFHFGAGLKSQPSDISDLSPLFCYYILVTRKMHSIESLWRLIMN